MSAAARRRRAEVPSLRRDDHETVERAAFLYDALYASLRQDAQERGASG